MKPLGRQKQDDRHGRTCSPTVAKAPRMGHIFIVTCITYPARDIGHVYTIFTSAHSERAAAVGGTTYDHIKRPPLLKPLVATPVNMGHERACARYFTAGAQPKRRHLSWPRGSSHKRLLDHTQGLTWCLSVVQVYKNGTHKTAFPVSRLSALR